MTNIISKSQIVKYVLAAVMCVISLNVANAQSKADNSATICQQAADCLNYAVMNPQDVKTDSLLESAKALINKAETTSGADQSDIAMLKGFYYTCLVVKNTKVNGQFFYKEALGYLDEALRLNPDNKSAKFLKDKFNEGMNAALGKK